MLETYNLNCCGVVELDNLQLTYEAGGITAVMAGLWIGRHNAGRGGGSVPAAFVIFTNARTFTSGNALARVIRRNRLGTVTTSPAARNPNTHNALTLWVWTIDHKRLASFFRANEKKYQALADKGGL